MASELTQSYPINIKVLKLINQHLNQKENDDVGKIKAVHFNVSDIVVSVVYRHNLTPMAWYTHI